MSAAPIYLDNDYRLEVAITRTNTSTGLREPATGLTLTARLALTDGGPAINGALTATLTEASGKPGTYFGRLDGDVLRAQDTAGALPSRAVWIVTGDGTNVLVSEQTTVQRTRRPA
jgi:hypothetical protein